ncbi:hypothetical protein ACFL6X_04730 [Candidatus Latescibacterota bacterium]
MTETEPLHMGDRRQLLFDDRFLDEAVGVTHVLERPCLPPDNLLPSVHPWESTRAGAYLSACCLDGRFRCPERAYGRTEVPQGQLDQADTLYGNGLEVLASWNGENHVGGLAGQPLRLEVSFERGRLCAFEFRSDGQQA